MDNEILISINKNYHLVSFEFPDGNLIELPKDSLGTCSNYFRTIFQKQIENQYITINDYNKEQAMFFKHFLICLANGYRNIISELPFEDSIKLLQFDFFLELNPEITTSLTEKLADQEYENIKTYYSSYWNFKYVSFVAAAKLALKEKNLSVMMDWLSEDLWEKNALIVSEEFKLCKNFVELYPELIPNNTIELLLQLEKYKTSYLIIDVKLLIRSLNPTLIIPLNYKSNH